MTEFCCGAWGGDRTLAASKLGLAVFGTASEIIWGGVFPSHQFFSGNGWGESFFFRVEWDEQCPKYAGKSRCDTVLCHLWRIINHFVSHPLLCIIIISSPFRSAARRVLEKLSTDGKTFAHSPVIAACRTFLRSLKNTENIFLDMKVRSSDLSHPLCFERNGNASPIFADFLSKKRENKVTSVILWSMNFHWNLVLPQAAMRSVHFFEKKIETSVWTISWYLEVKFRWSFPL